MPAEVKTHRELVAGMVVRWLVVATGLALARATCPTAGVIPNATTPGPYYLHTLEGLNLPISGNYRTSGFAQINSQVCSTVFLGPYERNVYEVVTQTGPLANRSFPGFELACIGGGLITEVGAWLGNDYTTTVRSWVTPDQKAVVFIGLKKPMKFVKLFFTCLFFD